MSQENDSLPASERGHRGRIVERLVETRLRTHGAVLLTGPKAVGKTTTARCFAASEVRLDEGRAALTAAQTDPRLVLDGEHPRLIDEYQLAAGIWNAVRGRVDDLGGKGLFLLTGSATPEYEEVSHTGARRIAAAPMRTMTLLERGLSSSAVSLGALLELETTPAVECPTRGDAEASSRRSLAGGCGPRGHAAAAAGSRGRACRLSLRVADDPRPARLRPAASGGRPLLPRQQGAGDRRDRRGARRSLARGGGQAGTQPRGPGRP